GVIDGKRAALSAVVSSVGTPGGIASGEGAVWVTDTADDVVLRIDPVRRTAERVPVGHGPTGVVVGDDEVWVVNQLERNVSEINPRALKQVNTFPVGNGATAAAYGDGSLWVADTTDNAVSRIDPTTGHAVQIDLGAGVPQGIAVGKEGVWVTSSTGELLLIDPGSNRVTFAYPIGNGAEGVAVGAGRVWVANATDGTVSRFDPGTAGVHKIPVRSPPSGVRRRESPTAPAPCGSRTASTARLLGSIRVRVQCDWSAWATSLRRSRSWARVCGRPFVLRLRATGEGP